MPWIRRRAPPFPSMGPELSRLKMLGSPPATIWAWSMAAYSSFSRTPGAAASIMASTVLRAMAPDFSSMAISSGLLMRRSSSTISLSSLSDASGSAEVRAR